jgi:hypothetical protein
VPCPWNERRIAAPTSSVTTGCPDPGSGNLLNLLAARRWEHRRSSFETAIEVPFATRGVGNIGEVLLRTAFWSIALEHLIVTRGTTARGRRTEWIDERGGARDGSLNAYAAAMGRRFLSLGRS